MINPAPLPGGVGAITHTSDHTPTVADRQHRLRPYQTDVITRVEAEIAGGRRRILLVAPTGSGKTVIAAELIRRARDRGERSLVVDHRRELTTQASRKLHDVGIDHGIIQAGFPPRPGERAQIASIQTLTARAMRSRAMELPQADLLIIDEAHHSRAETYGDVIAAYPDATVIGLTATPCRGDGRGLGGDMYEVMVECPQVSELIRQGYLVPPRVYAPVTPDLTGVQVRRGDYVEGQLAARLNTDQLVGDIVTHWHRLAERRPTVIFATGVAHSVHIRDELRRSGVMAEHIDGGTPADERDAILSGLATGKVEVVTNCAVLTEGFDCPDIGALVLARPTKSLGLYRQMVGRALRPAPAETDAIILDHSGATLALGLPDDDIAWTLDPDTGAVNQSAARRGAAAGDAGPLTTCPECHAIRMRGQPCAVCGWAPRTRGVAIDVIDGDLGLVDRDRRVRQAVTDPRRFYAELVGIAAQRGYKPGWAAHKYRERHGMWPPWRHVQPEAPSAVTLAWVRSRQIAYARARAKGAA